jgi:cytochrome c oxidase subunit 3
MDMADVAAPPSHAEHAPPGIPAEDITTKHPPVSPGKVAMWLFLATEVMFFTGLIGSYIVLRSGSPPTAYSNLYPPGTDLTLLQGTWGVALESVGSDTHRTEEILRNVGHLTARQTEEILESAHHQAHAVFGGLKNEADAQRVVHELEAAGAHAAPLPLKQYNWPLPYDDLTNPLSIDLTAVNTFILICSSVTMVLALSAIQRGDRAKGNLFLIATVLIGSTFLSIQVIEYFLLSVGHHYPQGIASIHHFRPSVSLFASCFYTMTGFHGAHVAGGVILLTCITIASLRGTFSRTNYSAVELAGLYWHFVDLVWIILFTVVYLI